MSRWRRAADNERAQLSWFALAAVLLVGAVMVPGTLGVLLGLVAVPLLPVAIAVAVLRRHLYGVEVVIARSLVYATLTVVLLLVYAATVIVLGSLVQDRSNPAVSLAATALVAIGFAPVRDRLQSAARRLLFGDREDPYRVLTGLGRRLDVVDAASSSDDGVLEEIVQALATSLRLPYVRVEVGRPGSGDIQSACLGQPAAGVRAVDLTFRGESIGRLEVAPRTPREPFTAAEATLLDDLGRQIGVSAHAMLLSRDLQRSRGRLVTTREEERRRIRRDLHDGLGPALAGIALGMDAVSRLVRSRPDEAARLAEQLKLEVQASLLDVRRLVEDLRPPALDQLGLVGAVRQQAARMSERGSGLDVDVAVHALPPLPAAVEVAAYRITTEALTNVARHAGAQTCRIDLAVDDAGGLLVEVEDDGVGLPAHRRAGIGIASMRERATELGGSCEMAGGSRGGTRVTARIPLAAS